MQNMINECTDPLRVYALEIKDFISYIRFLHFIDYVDDEKRKRIFKFYHLEDAQRCLFSDLLARYMLWKSTGESIRNTAFQVGSYGKPYCSNFDIHFNISHSDRMILGVIGNSEVGIDIERITGADIDIAKQFFTEDERNLILSQKDEDIRSKVFFEIWTRKESFLKAIGTGLNTSLTSFDVCGDQVCYEGRQYDIRNIDVKPEYKAAICTGEGSNPIVVRLLKLDDFLQEMVTAYNSWGNTVL
ncbi:MAG TPA: 4'-phosphopantetheinyl transferase superfamily protein [Lachnospiraceae bacterium]|nr:4'-phosphopantetheinyl transferase superfamily protein [Lachnospiraceae bacterium]